MMKTETLMIKLNNTLVGYLTHYQDGKNIFVFDENYINAPPASRPVLSRSFINFDQSYIARQRLPEFFSNLLPEGELRSLIASQLHTHMDDEFSLLSALGHDLPGAIIAEKANTSTSSGSKKKTRVPLVDSSEHVFHFSLAGVQLKFSMLKEKSWFTLSDNLMPGNFIIKTPSFLYPNVPENEYSMMKLAEAVGINIPEIQLILLTQLKNLPNIHLPNEKHAYAIKRFDRSDQTRIHIEDFAQVFTIKPQKKYQASNYETMARFIYADLPENDQAITEFLRQVFFNILIGNTDAHLKNWSIIYPDGVTPRLAPAYDLVSTLPYLKNRELALNFSKQKNFYAIDKESLRYFAKRTQIPETLIIQVAKETADHFKAAWKELHPTLPINSILEAALKEHWQQLPLYQLSFS